MKNISCKITFENQFNIAEDETKKNIKILMLKGEKGEKGDVKNLEWGKITGNIANQNDLKQMIETNLTPYIKKDEKNAVRRKY